TGMSGLDLYAVDKNGGWHWAPGKYDFGEKPGDTIMYTFEVSKGDAADKNGREYVLYLPIYNTVDWLKIGTPRTAPSIRR
ncbi:MAG: SGNH/GDSL hydrolase N-terminal domain-containing protein, partial [Armatimonadota bacterium]